MFLSQRLPGSPPCSMSILNPQPGDRREERQVSEMSHFPGALACASWEGRYGESYLLPTCQQEGCSRAMFEQIPNILSPKHFFVFLTLIILVPLQPNDALRYGPMQNESVGSLVQNAGRSTTRYSHKGFSFLLQFLFTVYLFAI